MTARNKKILAISASAAFLALVSFISLAYFENQSIGRIVQRLDLVKEGMSEQEVIGLLGKPEAGEWIDTEQLDLPAKIKEKYGKMYVYYYSFDTFMNKLPISKLFPSRWYISTIIVLDSTNGKVIAETGRSIGDIGMITEVNID